MNIIMYTRKEPVCNFCESAKKLLTDRQVPFTEYVIPDDVDRDAVKEAYPDAKTVPVIVIDGEWIGGYQELQQIVGGR